MEFRRVLFRSDGGGAANTDAKRPATPMLNQALALAIERPAIFFQSAAVQQQLHQRQRNEFGALPAHLRRSRRRPDAFRGGHKTGVALKRKTGAEAHGGPFGVARR